MESLMLSCSFLLPIAPIPRFLKPLLYPFSCCSLLWQLLLWNANIGAVVLPMILVIGMVAVAAFQSGLPLISPRLREALHGTKEVAAGLP
jgi:hypothetical protein